MEMDSKDQNLDLTRTKRIHFLLLGQVNVHDKRRRDNQSMYRFSLDCKFTTRNGFTPI